jgi:hypothetical protein
VKPTDDTIALVGFLLGRDALFADELWHALQRLGFDPPSRQWVSGRLLAMTRESSPRFVRTFNHLVGAYEYSVTSWAATGLSNTWRGFTRPTRDLPTPKPEERA